MRNILIMTLCVLFAGSAALGDWIPGDGYKMHFPQLPHRNGWDVNFTWPKVLADDWRCIEDGPVKDIHFWFSARADELIPPDQFIQSIHVSIHDDDRSGTFSKPGNLLWEEDFPTGTFEIRHWGTGQQGFYDPNPPRVVEPYDHFLTWQANITDIEDAFPQKAGEIYWLDLSVTSSDPSPGLEYGWKTSLDHFEDAAVWGDFNAAGKVDEWLPLYDPSTGEKFDLAFVITPEPATMSLLVLGGIAVLSRRRRR